MSTEMLESVEGKRPMLRQVPPVAGYWRLACYLFISLLFHALFFYLFTVSPPPPEKKRAPNHTITLLPPDSVETLAMLLPVEHKIPLGLLPISVGGKRQEDEVPPSFARQPSYLRHRAMPELSIDVPKETVSLTGLFADPSLPGGPVAGTAATKTTSPSSMASANLKAAPMPTAHLRLPAALRARRRAEATPWTFAAVNLEETATVLHAFSLAVNADGRVTSVFPVSGALATQIPPGLVESLRGLRFLPDAEGRSLWADVEVTLFPPPAAAEEPSATLLGDEDVSFE